MIHRLETNKLRNVAKFYAHLIGTDALPWTLLSYIELTEDNTTSSSRIFIKILFQELAEALGLPKLAARLAQPALSAAVAGIFPKDSARNTRFAINFFTSIGLGGVTDGLREHLRNLPKLLQQQKEAAEAAAAAEARRRGAAGGGSDSDTTSSSDSDTTSTSSSDSDSSDSDTSSSGSDTSSDTSTSSDSSDSDSSGRGRRRKGGRKGGGGRARGPSPKRTRRS